MKHSLISVIDSVYPEAIKLRRELHRNPELSGEEFETAKFIHRYLTGLGLKPHYHVHKTGVTARIVNGIGKTVVLRADTDALPIDEHNNLPFKSVRPGSMHACGHDIHTACLLAAAKVLCSVKDLWKGTIVVLFQPSEEVAPGGALPMIQEKAFPEKVDAVFGLHVSTDHAAGQVGIKTGRDYAGVMDFDVRITGRGGHGATPHMTDDSIVSACSVILALQTLVSRECPSWEPSVLSVGSLHAGNKHNIIPGEAVFSGTVRTFSEEHQQFLERRIKEIVTNIALSHNTRGTCTFIHSYPPGHNDEHLTKCSIQGLSELLGPQNIITRTIPTMFAEDFAYYQQKTPGLYVHLGVNKPGTRRHAGIHSPNFLPDERALRTGIAVQAGLAIHFLKDNC